MSDKRRISLFSARYLAEEVVGLLRDSCERIVVAGSIRRRKVDVGDVEIVCIPKFAPTTVGLFGEPGEPRDLLADRCRELLTDGVFHTRLDVNGRSALGSKYRRLLYRGFPLDLFSTTADQWGVILTIRTGPAEFSHRAVTQRRQGGLLPDWLKVRDGLIWHGDEALSTPEERDVFEALKLPWIPPEQRTGNERAAPAAVTAKEARA